MLIPHALREPPHLIGLSNKKPLSRLCLEYEVRNLIPHFVL